MNTKYGDLLTELPTINTKPSQIESDIVDMFFKKKSKGVNPVYKFYIFLVVFYILISTPHFSKFFDLLLAGVSIYIKTAIKGVILALLVYSSVKISS